MRSFGILSFFIVSFLYATVLRPLSTQKLLSSSSVVAYGKIEKLEWNPETGRRVAFLKSEKDLWIQKNNQGQKIKTFSQRKQSYPIALQTRYYPKIDRVEWVPLSAEFKEGEKVLVFLTPLVKNRNSASLFRVVGMIQGKMQILEDPQGRERVVSWLSQLKNVQDFKEKIRILYQDQDKVLKAFEEYPELTAYFQHLEKIYRNLP